MQSLIFHIAGVDSAATSAATAVAPDLHDAIIDTGAIRWNMKLNIDGLQVAASKMGPDDLWKLEFPQISDNTVGSARRSFPSHDHSASIEKKANSEKPAKRGSKQDTALPIKQVIQERTVITKHTHRSTNHSSRH